MSDELKELKKRVFAANLELPKRGLVTYTWGNVSGITKDRSRIVIKPSGVSYEDMAAADMVVVDVDGNTLDGDYRPSSDLATHLEFYKNFPECGGVVHTHSRMATSWAQSELDIPAFGTTHADYFYGDIPCTRQLTRDEIESDYEVNTGKVIVDTFTQREIDPVSIPGVLAACHGPFTWGKDPEEAVHNSVVLEELAAMAFNVMVLDPDHPSIPSVILDKHYLRKHGKNAYYGQK